MSLRQAYAHHQFSKFNHDRSLLCGAVGEVSRMKDRNRTTDEGGRRGLLHPRFVGALLLVAIAATTISIISAHAIRKQWYQTEEHLRSTAEDRQKALDSLERVFSAMMRQRARDDYSVSPETVEVLAELTDSYNQFVIRNANDPSLRVDRMRAYRLLGQVYSLQNQVDLAEATYREAMKILVELIAEDRRPGYCYLLAETSQQLSHLLAELDRTEEAEQLSLDAMRELAKLATEHPNAPPYSSDLAVAYNNLGLLALRLGRNGEAEQYLRQNLSTIENLVKKFPDVNAYVDRMIDSQQILVGLLWSTGQLEAAREMSVQSLSTIRHCRESRQGALELENALNMAEENRAGIEKGLAFQQDADPAPVEVSSADSLFFSEWSWQPLFPHDGKSIQPDILIKGVLPADFERHDALLLGFTWELGEVWEEACLPIVAAAWQRVEIIILVPDAPAQELVIERLRQVNIPVDRIRFYQVPTNTIWVRDFGPLVIRASRGGYKWVDLQYGAITRARDDCVPSMLGRLMGIPRVRASIALDGGNLLTNGQGLCIATTQLLQINRDRGYSENHVASTIKRLFGAEEIVYLEKLNVQAVGHVDLFATFVAADTVVVGDYTGIDPVNAAILDRNAERLRGVVTPSGPLKVVRIPMPPHGKDHFGGTYTNVLFANGILLVPTYPHASREMEDRVMATYRRLLPEWEVVGIDAGALVSNGGVLRCAALPLHRIRSINGTARIEPGVEYRARD